MGYKNQQSKNLIKSKIAEIKNRDFGPNPNKALRLADENNPDLTFFYLNLPFTSYKCSGIATKYATNKIHFRKIYAKLPS